MTLAEIREHVVKRSGRYDLVGTTGGLPDFTVDNGIDAYINEAMQYLCDRLPELCETRYVDGTVSAGAYEITVDYLRQAEMLRLWDASKSLVKPLMKSEAWMVDNYAHVLGSADLEQGVPAHWCEVSENAGGSGGMSTSSRLGVLEFIVSRMAGIEDTTAAFAYGVLGDGLVVTQTTGFPTMAVTVAEGIGFVDSVPVALEAVDLTEVMEAPNMYPRIDKVCIGSDSILHVVEGIEAAAPVALATPTGYLLLATIYHRVGETHIHTVDDGVNGYLTDARVWCNK